MFLGKYRSNESLICNDRYCSFEDEVVNILRGYICNVRRYTNG